MIGFITVIGFLFILLGIGVFAPVLFKKLGFTNYLAEEKFWAWVIGVIFVIAILIVGAL